MGYRSSFTGENRTQLENIVYELRNFQIFDLLARISSLNLLPDNQNKSVVLDALTNSLLKREKDEYGVNIISNSRFKRIIQQCMNTGLSMRIDPAEQPFVQRVRFFGNHWLLNGINNDLTYNLQVFIDILFLHNNGFPKDFLNRCNGIVDALLKISTSCCERLGYSNDSVCSNKIDEVLIPDANDFKKLISCVIVDSATLEAKISDEDIPYLYSDFGAENNTKDDPNNYSFFYHPFIKIDTNTSLILNPTMLGVYIISSIIRIAKEYHIFDRLIREYNNCSWNNCREYLSRLGHYPIKTDLFGFFPMDKPDYKESVLNIGNDSLLVVQYLCDDGSNYTLDNFFDLYCGNVDCYEDRAELLITKSRCPSDKVFQIVILSSFGRGIYVGFRTKQCKKSMSISPFGLQCISINERNHKNFLPRYMNAKVIYGKNEFMPYPDINLISMYVSYDYSFYFDDTVNIRNVMLLPDFSYTMDYIIRAIKKEDRQLFCAADEIYFREAILVDSFRKIYSSDMKKGLMLINHFANIDIFVCVKEIDTIPSMQAATSIVDMLTYWLGECKELIEKSSFVCDSIEISIAIPKTISPVVSDIDISNKSVQELLSVEILGNTIYVSWSDNVFQSIAVSENSLEYEIISFFIDKLSYFTYMPMDVNAVKDIFTNPLKTKIYKQDLTANPELVPSNLSLRRISAECENLILDEIGQIFTEDSEKRALIDNKKNSEVCNTIVDYLYEKLKTAIFPFDITGVIETIYRDIESQSYWFALHQERYSYNISCYPEKRSEIENEFIEINQFLVSAKFLIEYLIAVPPAGKKLLGELDYEYLLAICAQIIEWAHRGDLFYYKIINNEIRLLGSGRVSFNKTQYNQLRDETHRAHIKRMEIGSDPSSKKYLPKKIIDNITQELDRAFRSDYGYTYSQLYLFHFAVIQYGNELKDEVKCSGKDLFYARITTLTGIEKSVIDLILNDFSIKPRDDFLKPDKPFSSNDVYPWKNNRALSLNRRPFVVRDYEIIWGNRQLSNCINLLYNNILNGTYKPKSGKIGMVVGRIANARGNDFNEMVADRLKAFQGLLIDSKVKKINGRSIELLKGQTLGDIDVLIINEKKKRIVVCEVKDFSVTKSPYEMYQEYLEVFCDKGDKLCYVSKHKRRVAWIKEHISDVISHYGLENGTWSVGEVMIVNEIIVSNEYYHKHQKIVLFSDITEKLIKSL